MSRVGTGPIRIDAAVLDEAREFFEDRGSHGLEGPRCWRAPPPSTESIVC
ncbi:MAG TPA: hypothetical protein VGH14_04380 [Solirubrobacterales bacterium]|jgi:hypothetical protein